jgi:ribosomal protein S18 acetylase RimI-like enzyme
VIEAVRPATAADVARLAELAELAVDEQVGDRGGAIWAVREARPVPAAPTLSGSLEDPSQCVLCGTIDDVVVAYAVARLEGLRSGDLLGVLTDVYVEAGAREVGIGELLVDEVVAWCRKRGGVGVDALVLPGNRSTKNFFEMLGFTARALVVHKSLT